ncbi:DEAD/DEAH box helicase family protein, partial [Sphaerospermopsis sp. FACHB-1194]|uniref:DEAD/DEAH box helicase family protein n=1 Tax=Sphaerospermopsis sp. FACHB-1194 TaxID=2692862 RepID=UPI0016803E60
AAFNMLHSVGSETLDPANSLDKSTIDKVNKTLAFYCKREKIGNPLEIDDQPKLDPTKSSLRFSDLSKSTYLNWTRFSESCEPLHIVFGNADLLPAIPMVAIPDVKQTNHEYINYDVREGLKPFIGNKREISITTKNAKQWTKSDFVNLVKFITANNGSKNKVNDCQLTIDDQDMFDYLADDLIDNQLSLNSLDICLDDREVDIDYLISEIEKRQSKNIYFEAPHGLGKTTFSTALSTYFWELFNIATVVVTPTISLRKNCGVGYKLPQVDENFWIHQNQKNFRGCVTCLDSLFTRVMPLLEEHDIKYILIFDECSKNISHLHTGDTHIKKDRALHLSKVEKLLNCSELNVFLDADVYQSVFNYVQKSAPRNSLKIGTSFRFDREFVLWNGSSPKEMIKAVHLIRLNEPNATINVNSQSAKFDATYTPKNIANALMDMGIWFEDIVVHDGDSLEPDHPGFDILSKPKHVQEAYFEKFCKGKIIITNQNFFSSGVSVANHCFDYQFNIFYNQGLPTDALQIPLRLRDKQGLQRHIWVANAVLGSSTLTGYTPKQVEEQLNLKIQYFDKGYERLRGYYNPADLVRSALSSQYMYEMIALESNLKTGSMFRRVVLRLIKYKQNWTLLEADKWMEEYKSGVAKETIDRVYSPKTEIGQSDLYSAIKKSQVETIDGKNGEVALSRLISDDDYKNLINQNQKFSREEETLLDRYQFNKSCLGVIPNPNKDDIQLWRDGFWRKLKSEFSLLIDRFWFTRIEESIKLEKSAKNKHFFAFDWVKKSDLPRLVYLRELGLDMLIREKYWLEIGSIKFESSKFIKSPNQEFSKEVEVNGEKLTVILTGTKLDLSKGSLLQSIAEKIANEPLKAKNLLGFKPEKTTLAIIRQVLDIFGHKIETVGNGKATKYVLIRENNQELRNIYHETMRKLIGLSAFNENNLYADFIDELAIANNEPITLDAKAIKAAIPQVDVKSQFNISDLVDIGQAALEGEVSIKLVPSFP